MDNQGGTVDQGGQEHTFSQDFVNPRGNQSRKKTLAGIFIVLGIALLLAGAFFAYRAVIGGTTTPSAGTPTPQIQVVVPSPSPEPALVFSEYKVQVLNGSGTAGEAGRVEALLKAGGFTDVVTGNADAFDYKTTEVSVKSGAPRQLFEEIRKALASYSPTKADTLPDTSEFDVVIIVGEKPSE